MLLVSQCLTGACCRYDGGTNLMPWVKALVEAGEAVSVCPEVLGGLPTPRCPSELQPDGRVVNRQGEDVTAAFREGAARALAIGQAQGCTGAILKARSPSCGVGEVYDGTFSHTLTPGNGIFAQLLLENGIPVRTEEDGIMNTEE